MRKTAAKKPPTRRPPATKPAANAPSGGHLAANAIRMAQKPPVVTISMTVYNTPPKLLRRAVMGILAQSETRWRLIIVNDGGDTVCWSGLDGIEDGRIERIDREDNLGTYARHAETLAMCKTPWWSPHDSDDYCASDRYAALLEAVGDDTDVVLGGYTKVMPDGQATAIVPKQQTARGGWQKDITAWGGSLWRTDWLRRAGGFDPSYRTSYDSALQTLALTFGTVDTIPHIGQYRCLRPESLTRDPRTGFGSAYRLAVQRHIGGKMASIPQGATLEEAARIVNTGTFVFPDPASARPIAIVGNVIALDSEPELPDMLRSLEGKLDGLVLVDGGSGDRTAEIAKRWVARQKGQGGNAFVSSVSVVPWPDDFAAQRNVCLDRTRDILSGLSGEPDVWVLSVDTDDTLKDFDRPYIEKVIREYGVESVMATVGGERDSFTATRMFALKDSTVWKNPIHEYIVCESTKAVLPDGKLSIYCGHAKRHHADPFRNVRIGRKFVEENPNDRRGRFYLARDLMECRAAPYMERMAEAEGHLRIYMELTGTFVEQDRLARLLLCRIMWDTGRPDEARRLMIDSLLHDPDNRSAYEALENMTDNAAVWRRLANAAQGGCVLPYRSRLPQRR